MSTTAKQRRALRNALGKGFRDIGDTLDIHLKIADLSDIVLEYLHYRTRFGVVCKRCVADVAKDGWRVMTMGDFASREFCERFAYTYVYQQGVELLGDDFMPSNVLRLQSGYVCFRNEYLGFRQPVRELGSEAAAVAREHTVVRLLVTRYHKGMCRLSCVCVCVCVHIAAISCVLTSILYAGAPTCRLALHSVSGRYNDRLSVAGQSTWAPGQADGKQQGP